MKFLKRIFFIILLLSSVLLISSLNNLYKIGNNEENINNHVGDRLKKEITKKIESPDLHLITREIYSQIHSYKSLYYKIKHFKVNKFYIELEVYTSKTNLQVFIYPKIRLERQNKIRLTENLSEYFKSLDKFIYLIQKNQYKYLKDNGEKTDHIKKIYIFDPYKVYVYVKEK